MSKRRFESIFKTPYIPILHFMLSGFILRIWRSHGCIRWN